MLRHTCVTAWLYVLLALLAVAAAFASDGAPVAAGVQVDVVTQLVMQGGFGALALAELSRWRELGGQLLKLLDSALEDLRDGRMTVRHEHVDAEGHPVERRRPRRVRGDDAPQA